MISKLILVCLLAVTLSSCATREENQALAAGVVLGTILSQQSNKPENTNTQEQHKPMTQSNENHSDDHESKAENHESSMHDNHEDKHEKKYKKHGEDDDEDEHDD